MNEGSTLKAQTGAIMVLSMILMLLITIIGIFSVSSTRLEVQMAANAQFKNIIFQESEHAIEQSSSDMGLLGQSFAASLIAGEPSWPTTEVTEAKSENHYLGSNSIVEFAGFSIPKGDSFGSIRMGASGYSFYNYEIKGVASIQNTGASNTNVRGVYIKGARPE